MPDTTVKVTANFASAFHHPFHVFSSAVKFPVELQIIINIPPNIAITLKISIAPAICHAYTCMRRGSRSPLRERFFAESKRRSTLFACGWQERRCRRIACCAAVMTEVRARMSPQYQQARTVQGVVAPLGRMRGQEPVEVRTPARRAP